MLQSSEEAWTQIEMILNRLQDGTIVQALDATEKSFRAVPPAILLQVEDVYTGDPVVLRARLLNARASHKLEAELQMVNASSNEATVPLRVNGRLHEVNLPAAVGPGVFGTFRLEPDSQSSGKDWWVISFDGLPDGRYRVKIHTFSRSAAPVPVEDLFEVARPELRTGE
jgi:hypothetical protein